MHQRPEREASTEKALDPEHPLTRSGLFRAGSPASALRQSKTGRAKTLPGLACWLGKSQLQ